MFLYVLNTQYIVLNSKKVDEINKKNTILNKNRI